MVNRSQSAPLCPTNAAFEVGSATTIAPVRPRMPARASWNAPSQPISSPAVITRIAPLVPSSSLAMFPIAATKAATPHFMSLEPRPYILPSMISPANGSTLQEAFPSGTVSTCPVKHSGSLLPIFLVRAMRLARSGANVWIDVSSPAPSRILRKCNMQLSSFPGGLIVLKEISSRESSIGSIRISDSLRFVPEFYLSTHPHTTDSLGSFAGKLRFDLLGLVEELQIQPRRVARHFRISV